MADQQPSFKYSASVDPAHANTSHAIVLDLVGTGKRVLDVGCASGYLAAALTDAGNKVSGVEIDPEAAESARPFLERLVVGDLEEMDLVAEFGPQEFDVVVFADVLEHLKEPAGVLRRSRPLLAEGGFAVLSIPNVAHGSVRLALMKGRFEYRPTGLLDDTHLRFFTRDSLDQMLAEAGFVAVDRRQTTAGTFETEIPLKRADYPDDVVAAVERDPESRTYQFVLRADPVDAGSEAHEEVLSERTAELSRLRRTLAAIAAMAGAGPNRPVVGVLDPGGARPAQPPVEQRAAPPAESAALGALRMAVSVLELRRRLAGFEVRAFSLSPEVTVSELGEDMVQSLAPWGAGSAEALRTEVDALVVLPGPHGPLPPEAEAVLAELGEAGLAVHRLAGPESADPLVLAGRLADASLLDQRREYLAVSGQVPAAGPYVLCLPASSGGDELDERAGTGVAVVRPTGPLVPLDLLALVAGADAVVTDSAGVRVLAEGMGRPVGRPDGRPDGGHAAAERPAATGAERRAVLASRAERTFDDLYVALLDEAGSRLPATVAQRLASLDRRVVALEAVNAGLRQTLGRERFVMASEVRRRESAPSGPGGSWSAFNADRLARELAAAQNEMARLQGEIDRIYATRTMRAVAPVRRLYGRLRRFAP